MTLDDVAEELYGLPPEEFTEVRNARAKEIGATGNRELAAEVRRLPKPTVAAWLANALVRTRATMVEELIALGSELREAQSLGRREDMRRVAGSKARTHPTICRCRIAMCCRRGSLNGTTSAKTTGGDP